MPGNDDFYYEGFSSPNGTIVPDDVFDILAPQLKEAELRVLLYIIRRTFGFKKDSDNISLNQMVEGITTKDGRVLDLGTGMGKPAVLRGVKGLEQKGIVVTIRNSSPERGHEATTYELRFRDRPLYSKDTRGGIPRKQGHVSLEYPQQTVLQQTDNKRDISKEASREIAGEERDIIASLIGDFAQEMNDRAPVQSSITRALNLYRASMMDIEEFINAVYMSRRQTQTFTGAIAGGEPGQRHKMPYFFAILEDMLHLHAHLDASSPE
ncbi:hypothetical protein BH23CHL2_BH23CHL2_19820 [soil metagenome]